MLEADIGGVDVTGAKKILVSVPCDILEEIESIIKLDNINRSQLIRDAMKFYIGEKKKIHVREQMRRGYLEMAAINLTLAEEGLVAENQAYIYIEKKFSG